jgi:hypothetical protein
MAWLRQLWPRKSAVETSGCFLFNCQDMDCRYAQQAFGAVCDALRGAQGACALYEGDLFDFESVRRLARKGSCLRPSGATSPLQHLEAPFDAHAYVVAMWTDTPTNLSELHESLGAHSVPGYMGCLTLRSARRDRRWAEGKLHQLHLLQAMILKDGQVTQDMFHGEGDPASPGQVRRRAALPPEGDAAREDELADAGSGRGHYCAQCYEPVEWGYVVCPRCGSQEFI